MSLERNKGLVTKLKYSIFVVLALALVGTVASQTQLTILSDSNVDYRFSEDNEETGVWEIYFTADQEGEIEFQGAGSEVSLEGVEYFDGSWNSIQEEQTDPLLFNWPGASAEYGRITYEINEFEDYSGVLQMNGQERVVETTSSMEQTSTRIDFSQSPIEIPMRLCGFAGDFWECDPDEDQPGYEGEIVDLATDEQRVFELPENSDIIGASLIFETIEDQSFLELEDEGITFANLVDNDRKEILTFGDRKLQAFDQEGDLLWDFETNEGIVDISAGRVQHDGEIAQSLDNVMISTEDQIIVLDNNGLELWNVDGGSAGFEVSEVGRISADQDLQIEDTDSPDELLCLGCNERDEVEFNLPFEVDEDHEIFYLQTALNFIEGTERGLNLSIGESQYNIDTSSLSTNNIEEQRSDSGEADQMLEIDETGVLLDSLLADLDATEEFLRLPIALGPESSPDSEIEVQYGADTYSINVDDVSSAINVETYENTPATDSVIQLREDTVTLEVNDNIDSDSSVYLEFPVNRHPDETGGNLGIEIAGNSYTVSTDQVDATSQQEFGEQLVDADQAKRIYEDRNLTFNLDYEMPDEIESETLFLRTALSKTGELPEDLVIQIGEEQYTVSADELETDSSKEYSINDGSADNQTCVGCEDNLRPEFDLNALQIEDSGEVADISALMCREGEGGSLEMGRLGLDSNYDIEQEVPACSDGFEWVSQEVNGDDIRDNYLSFRCDDCDEENHYVIAQDDSTGGAYSRVRNQTSEEFFGVESDFMVNISTDTALQYDSVATEVDRNQINQNQNVTFSCSSCDESSHYRLMLTESSQGNTYIGDSQSVELVEDSNLISQVWTNTSLQNDVIKTRVDAQDFQGEETEINFTCEGCQEGYNLLTDTGSSGSTYIEGVLADRELDLNIIQKDIDYDWIELPITGEKFEEVSLSCEGCDRDFYTALDDESNLGSYKAVEGGFTENQGGSMARIWSNKSLNFDFLRTEIDVQDIENHDTATIECDSCGEHSFNMMVDENSNITTTEVAEGGLMIRLESFGSNLGNEVAAGTINDVRVFNSTGSEIWLNSTDTRVYDIGVDEVDLEEPGHEVIAATRSGLEVYSSTGNLIREYPEETEKWLRAVITADLLGQEDNQVIIAGNDGTITALDANNNPIWEYETNDSVRVLSKGNIVKESDTEILAGLSDGRIKILDKNGNLITTYEQGSQINSLAAGNLGFEGSTTGEVSGDEVGISTSERTEIFNFHYLPQDFEITIGAEDYSPEEGVFRGQYEIDEGALANIEDGMLQNCDLNEQGLCEITLTLSSSDDGEVRINQPNFEFYYELEDEVESRDEVVRWAQTEGVTAGEEIRFRALDIAYNSNPVFPIRVNRITSEAIQDIGSAGDFGGEIQFNDIIFPIGAATEIDLGLGNRNFWLMPSGDVRENDTIWYDSTAAESPIGLNSTDMAEESGEAVKNVTVQRTSQRTDPPTQFENVTIEIGINESKVAVNNFLEVDWNGDGEYTDITPSTTTCEVYEDVEVGDDMFKVCMDDTTGTDRVDKMEVIQPEVGSEGIETSETDYRTGGDTSFPPQLSDLEISPQEATWGTTHNVNATFQEHDDTISATLLVDYGEGWMDFGTEETDDELIQFNFETDKAWVGSPDYKVEYVDLDEEGDPKREYLESSERSFEVERRPITLNIDDSGKDEFDRIGESNVITASVFDEVSDTSVGENEVFCYLRSEGETLDIQLTGSQGECELEMSDLDNRNVGATEWFIEAEGADYYLNNATSSEDVVLLGNFEFGTNLTEEAIFLENDYNLSQTSLLTIFEIKDLTGESINPEQPDVTVEWGSAEIAAEIEDNEITSEINSEFINDQEVGDQNATVTLNDNNFNEKNKTHTLTVKDSFESSLSSSEEIISQDENIDLIAEFQRSNDDIIEPENVSFETPSGHCLDGIARNGSQYICEFSPSSSLESDEYNWTVEAEEEFNQHISDQDSFEIAGAINADVEVDQERLYRYLGSDEGTNELTYTIENITDEGAQELENSTYRLFIEEEEGSGFKEIYERNTGDQNYVTDSYVIEEDRKVGSTQFRIEIESETGDMVDHIEEIDIYGTLDPETKEASSVYVPSTETLTDGNFNTETELGINVTDQLGNEINDTNIDFNIPAGSCSIEGNNCTFEPSSLVEAGNYVWNASTTKDFYEEGQTNNESVKIRNIVSISDIEDTEQSEFGQESSISVQLENPREEFIGEDGFEAYLDTQQETDAEPLTGGSGVVEWVTTCEEYDLGEQQIGVNLQGENDFYSIYETTELFTLEVFNPLNVEIQQPLNRSDEDAQNYEQSDNVDLNVSVNGECGGADSDFDDEILWRAESEEASDIIGGSHESSWSIEDDFSGITDVSVEVQNDYYQDNTDQVEIIIAEVITLNVSNTPEQIIREMNDENNWTGLFETQIVTGQEINVSESELEEDWENFEIEWYIEDESEPSTVQTTDSDGKALAEIEFPAEYEPGEIDLTAILKPTNEEELDIDILAPEQTADTVIVDETTTQIVQAPDEVFYLDEETLDLDFEIASGNLEAINPSFEWRYERPEDDVSFSISSDKNVGEWVVSSSVYGEGELTATVDDEFIQASEDQKNIIGKREAEIGAWNPPSDIPKGEISELAAEIDIPGLQDASGYNVNFSVFNPNEEDDRELVDVAQTDQNGEAIIQWDASEYDPGLYTTFLEIEDDQDMFIERGENNLEERDISIADDVEVTAYFLDNLEAVPGTRDENNIHGTRFDSLPRHVVYRNAGPWQHPTEMYLGANLTAPKANQDGRSLVNGSEAVFEIEHDVTGETREVQTCLIDVENPKSVDEDFFDFYGCETVWDASATDNLDVGSYTMTIKVNPPSEDWTVQEETNIGIEVRGQLQVEVNQPDGSVPVYVMGENNNITLEGSVQDLEGNVYSDEDLDTVRWELGDSFALSGTSRSLEERDSWANHNNGGRNRLETWIDLFDPDTSWRIRSGTEYAFLIAEKEYFEPTLNTHRRDWRRSGGKDHRRNAFRLWNDGSERGETTGPPRFGGEVNNFATRRFSYRVPLDLRLGFPEEITDTDEDDMFTVRADAYRTGTDTTYTRFRGGYELECLNCSENTQVYSQGADSSLGRASAEWEFDFSEETYNEYYEFEIRASSSQIGEVTDTDDATVNEVIRVVRDLGAGEGDCEGSADNPEPGENVDVCPNEYGFEDLPRDYWLNETVDSIQGFADGEEGPDQPPADFDEFMNDEAYEGYDLRWLQYQQFGNESAEDYYEENVRWYGEHSFYDDLAAGGCNFDGNTDGEDDYFESRSYCTDFVITAEPPVFETVEGFTQYYRGNDQAPLQTFEVDVDYPTQDPFEFRVTTPARDRNVIDPEEEGNYPHTYTFDIDPSAKSGDFEVVMESITEELESAEETVMIYEDNQPAIIDSIEVPDRNLNPEDTEEVRANISLGTIRDGFTVTADGGDGQTEMSYDQATGEWVGQFSPTEADPDEVEIRVEHKSGYADSVATEPYEVNEHDPTATITDSTNQEPYNSDDTITFNLNLGDNDNDLDEYEVVDQTGTTVCSSTTISGGSFEGSCDADAADATDTSFTYTVYVEDSAGREGQASTNVELDNNAPDIVLIPYDSTADQEDEYAVIGGGEGAITLEAEVIDNENNLETVEFREDGPSGNVLCDGLTGNSEDVFSCTHDFGSQTTEVYVVGVDAAGNANNNNNRVLVVTEDPDVTITSPGENDALRGTVSVNADISDPDDALDTDSLEFEVDGRTYDLSGGSGSFDTNDAPDGEHTLTARASDFGGNTGEDSITIIIDNSLPEITFDSLSQDQIIDGSFTFEHTITNGVQGSGVSEASYDIVTSSTSGSLDNNYDVTADTETLDEGDHTIEIEAVDDAGNTRTRTRDFNVNNEPPEINLENPSLNELETEFYNQNIVAEFDINDEAGNDNPSTYRCEIQGEAVEDNAPENVGGTVYQCDLDVSSLTSGAYTLVAEAEDTQGRQNTETYSVNVDTDEPNLDLVEVPNENDLVVQPETEISVNAEVTDDTSSVVVVEADGQALTHEGAADWSGTITAPGVETASHSIEIFAEDEAGNTMTETGQAEIEVDDTDPAVVGFTSNARENQAGDDIAQSGEELEFEVDATDQNNNLDEVRIIDSDGNELNPKFAENLGGVSGGVYTLTTTPADLGLTAGTNNIEAVGEDLAENTGRDSYSIIVEDEDPEIDSITLGDDIVQVGTSIDVTSEVADEYLELVQFEHRGTTVDVSDQIENTENLQTFEASIESDGANEEEVEITVYAEDAVGNNASMTTTYQIDEESPVITEELTVEGGSEHVSRSDTVLGFELNATDNIEVDRVELYGAGSSVMMNRDGDRFFRNIEPRNLGCSQGVDFEECNIDAEIYDEAGNIELSRTVTANVDDIRPDVSGVSVDDNIVQTETDVLFEASISDGDSELITEIRDSSQTICELAEGGNYTCTHSFVDEGVYDLNVHAEDRAGNANEDAEIGVTVTDTEPVISNVEDNANEKEDVDNLRAQDVNDEEDTIGVVRSDESIQINVTAFDPDDLLESVSIAAGNVPEAEMEHIGGDQFRMIFGPDEEYSLIDLCGTQIVDGSHEPCQFSVVAEDEAGNVAEGLHTIIIDDFAAEIQEVNMQEDILSSGSETKVTVRLEDDQGSDTVKGVTAGAEISEDNSLEWNGTRWVGDIEVASTGQDDSIESLEVISTDYAENEDVNSDTQYTLDDRPPENIVIGSNATRDIAQSNVDVEFTVQAEDNVELSEIRIAEENEAAKQLVAEEIGLASTTESLVIEPETLGCMSNGDFDDCILEAQVIDEAGNDAFETYALTIDDQNPTIDQITLNNSVIAPHDIVRPNEQVDIVIDTDGESDDRTERFEINGEAMEDSNIEWDESTGNWTGVLGLDGQEGERTFEVYAIDWAENENTEQAGYVVDDNPPSTENLRTNSTNDIESSDTELRFMVDAFDENGLNEVAVEGMQMEYSDSGDMYELITTPDQLGCDEQADNSSDFCEVSATAVDNAGWTNETSYQILIENTDPVVNAYDLEGVIEGSPFDSSLPDEELNLTLNVTNTLSDVEADLYARNFSNGAFIGGPVDLGEAVDEGTEPEHEIYETAFAPQDLGATEWNVTFVANVTDQAGNTHEEPYTLNLDTVPPNIRELMVNNTEPETTRDVVEIKADISHFVSVEEAYVNITNREDEDFFEQIELEIDERDNDDDIDSGNFTAEFIPPESGTYDALLYAEDIFDEFDDREFDDIFTAIGDTDLNIQMNPTSQSFEDIDIDNPGTYELETTVTNIGQTTAYDVSLQPSNTVTGIHTNVTDLDCGDMAPWEECSVISEVNVTAEAGAGTKTTSAAASWENPDRTTDGTAEFVSKTIEANPQLEVTSEDHSIELLYEEPGELNVTLLNRGNIDLQNIEGDISSVANTDPEFINSLAPDNYSIEDIDLEIGEEKNAVIAIHGLEDRGEYPTGFEFDAIESSGACTEESCKEEISAEISLFKRSFIELADLNETVYRQGVIELETNVTDDNQDPVPGYNVSYVVDQEEPQLDEGVLEAIEQTGGLGESLVGLDLRDNPPGEYFINTSIQDFEEEYYRAENSEHSKSIEVREELNVDVNYISTETFWYEDDDPIEVHYTTTDVEGQPVQGADVVLRSNDVEDSDGFVDVGDCTTNSNGECEITYNTNRTSQTDAEIESEITTNEYYNGSPYSETEPIEILGGFSAIIRTPEGSDQLVRGNAYDLQASLQDNDGGALDPGEVEEINWTIYEGEISGENEIAPDPALEDDTNETVWEIAEDRDTGQYIIEISAEDDPDEPPVTDTITVGVYEAAMIENTVASSLETERKDSNIVFNLDIQDSNSNPIDGYDSCELRVSNEFINASSSGAEGECSLEWNTDENSSVGTNQAEISITEYQGETWYLPDPLGQTSEEFEITLTEEIDLEIIDPGRTIYTHRNISLTANTTDAYNRSLDAGVEWFLDGTEQLIGSGNETEWDTTDVGVGETLLNSTAEKDPFNSTFEEKEILVFGEAEHEFEIAQNYTADQIIDIVVPVNDTNTAQPVENHPVRLYKNGEPWTDLTEGEDSIGHTDSEGVFAAEWDASEEGLGDYNITAELLNSTDTFYNETTGNITRETSIVGEVNTELLSISEEEIYRDRLSEPLETVIEVQTIDEFSGDPVSGAENQFIINDQNVGECETEEDGICEFVWNPSNQTEIGELQGFVNTSVENYVPDQSDEFNITVRTGSKPELNVEGEQGYNFSESQGIDINATVLESFTDARIENYDFKLGWGTRDPIHEASLEQEDWEENEQVETTAQGLAINNTEASKELNLEGIDLVEVLVDNNEADWQINVTTEEESYIETSNSTSERIMLDNSTVQEVKIDTNETVTLIDLTLSSTEIQNRRELMNTEVIGNETAFDDDLGDFESAQINTDYFDTIADSGDDPRGWYVIDTEYIAVNKSAGLFGTPSLQLSLEEMPENETARIIKEYDTRTSAYSETEIFEFWMNSPLNAELTLNAHDSECSTTYTVNSTSWDQNQVNITDYHDECSRDIDNFELEFNNTIEESLNDTISVDQFRRYEPADTTEKGVNSLQWLPTGVGTYSFKLEITGEKFYNTTKVMDIADVTIFSTGGGTSPEDDEDEDDIPGEADGGAESFSVTPQSLSETVGLNTFGDTESITVTNEADEPINISFGVVEGELIQKPEKVEIERNRETEIQIPYETTELGLFQNVLAIFNPETGEREDVNVTIDVQPIEMEIVDIKAENGLKNIAPGDGVTFNSTISLEEETVNESVDWGARFGGEQCINVESTFDGESQLWNINCEAPEIEFNPIQVDTLLRAEYQGAKLNDKIPKEDEVVEYRDITGPFINSTSAENVEVGETSEIEVKAWDNTGIDDSEISAYVEYLDQDQVVEEDMTITGSNGEYYSQFDQIAAEGDYDAVFNLTDINGNSRIVRVPISVHQRVGVNGTLAQETEFGFRRPETDQTLEEFTVEDENYNFTVQNRTYDMGITTGAETSDGQEQEHTVEFKKSQLTNVTDPVNITGGPTGESPGFEHPEGTSNYTFSSIAYNTSIEYEGAEVILDYKESGVSPDQEPEEDLSIFRCSSGLISNCTSEDWIMLDSAVDTDKKKVSALTGTSSSYIIERQVSGGDEEDDGGEEGDEEDDGGEEGDDGDGDGDDDQDSAGGAPPGDEDDGGDEDEIADLLEEMLGSQAEELTDEELDTLADHIGDESDLEEISDEELEGMLEALREGDLEGDQPLAITPRIYHPVMERGETRTFFMEITNNLNSETQVELSASGEIEDIITFVDEEPEIPADSSTITEMIVDIPEDADTGSYSGTITAQHEDFNISSDHQILIVREGTGGIEMNIQTLTQTISQGENLKFEVDIGSIELTTPINASMEYFVRKSETDEIVAEMNESVEIDEQINFQREIDLNDDIERDNYYIQAVANYENVMVSDSATFTVGDIFWTPFKRNAALLIIAVLLISGAGWGSYRYYWTKKEDESRYVFPVDYSKLPDTVDDNYWVGKVAETEQEAYIDPDDLTTHAIVSGSTGSGKSVTASLIAEEALENDVPVIVFDPTAQWTGFVKELKDDNLIEHYERFDLDETEDPHPYRGVIKEINSEDPDIDFDELRNPGEITVFTLNKLTTEQFDQAVRKIIDQIFEKEWEESPTLELLIVFDEVHRLLEEYGGEGGYHALEKGAREFRKWGIGLMMCSQVTADFKQAISGNIMTEIQMQTKSMSDIDRVETKYGEEFAKRISSEDVGVGMIQNSNYNDGDPWFVDFRPSYHNPHKIPDQELEKYHKLSKELSELKQTLKTRKEKGEDVRDKDLELQLAENKLKEGRFKMAKMYIDSLKDEMDL